VRGIRVIKLQYCVILALGVVLALLVCFPGVANAANPYIIRDDATGGECSAIGIWNPLTKTCTLTTDITATWHGFRIDSNGVTLDGNGHTATGTSAGLTSGVLLNSKSNITVMNLNLSGFALGVKVTNGSGNNFLNNTILNTGTAFLLDGSSNNSLTNNTVDACTSGFVSLNPGIKLQNATGNTLTNNSVSNCGAGILLTGSGSNTMTGNTMSANDMNFNVSGAADADYYNTIDTSNLVDSKPIYYLVGQIGAVVDASTNAGTLFCIDCDQLTATGLSITNNLVGIYLRNTTNSVLSGNTVTNSGEGITVEFCSDNVLKGNQSSNNTWAGIALRNSTGNRVVGNFASANGSTNFGYGLDVSSSSGNMVYNNEFDNVRQANDAGGGNSYNLSSPTGGNHWADYDTPAEGCNDGDSDGFCDAPYIFSGGQDDLPWASSQGWGDQITIGLHVSSVYWGSMADYQAGLLSVDYFIDSFFDVSDVEVVGSDSTQGVSSASALPLPLAADLAPGNTAAFTLKYDVPSGVSVFRTTTYFTLIDTAGNLDQYPGTYLPGP